MEEPLLFYISNYTDDDHQDVSSTAEEFELPLEGIDIPVTTDQVKLRFSPVCKEEPVQDNGLISYDDGKWTDIQVPTVSTDTKDEKPTAQEAADVSPNPPADAHKPLQAMRKATKPKTNHTKSSHLKMQATQNASTRSSLEKMVGRSAKSKARRTSSLQQKARVDTSFGWYKKLKQPRTGKTANNKTEVMLVESTSISPKVHPYLSSRAETNDQAYNLDAKHTNTANHSDVVEVDNLYSQESDRNKSHNMQSKEIKRTKKSHTVKSRKSSKAQTTPKRHRNVATTSNFPGNSIPDSGQLQNSNVIGTLSEIDPVQNGQMHAANAMKPTENEKNHLQHGTMQVNQKEGEGKNQRNCTKSHGDSMNDDYSCSICKKYFATKQCVKKHLQTVHRNERPFKCDKCHKTYKNFDGLKSHCASVHDKDYNFACTECDRKFTHAQYLKKHMLKIHYPSLSKKNPKGKKTDVHKCPLCQKIFASSQTLHNHQKVHSGDKPFKCSENGCDAAFTTKFNLQRHVEIKHTGLPSELTECKICGKTFSRAECLKIHMRNHTGEMPWSCEHCGKGFHRRDTWSLHVKNTHEKSGAYKCKICDKAFNTQASLYQHNKIHEERSYKCGECGKAFQFRTMYKIHMQKQHGITVDNSHLQCRLCGMSFARSSLVKRHMDLKHPDSNE